MTDVKALGPTRQGPTHCRRPEPSQAIQNVSNTVRSSAMASIALDTHASKAPPPPCMADQLTPSCTSSPARSAGRGGTGSEPYYAFL